MWKLYHFCLNTGRQRVIIQKHSCLCMADNVLRVHSDMREVPALTLCCCGWVTVCFACASCTWHCSLRGPWLHPLDICSWASAVPAVSAEADLWAAVLSACAANVLGYLSCGNWHKWSCKGSLLCRKCVFLLICQHPAPVDTMVPGVPFSSQLWEWCRSWGLFCRRPWNGAWDHWLSLYPWPTGYTVGSLRSLVQCTIWLRRSEMLYEHGFQLVRMHLLVVWGHLTVMQWMWSLLRRLIGHSSIGFLQCLVARSKATARVMQKLLETAEATNLCVAA